MALRLEDVHPPKTAATQSLVMSFSAFSAKTVGSDAPSSATTSSCLPRTPPSALISLTARSSESRTVCSEIAIVPERELRKPIFTASPSVSTHEAAAEVSAVLSPVLAPQPERPRTRTSAEAGSTRASRRDVVIGGPFAVAAATGNQPT